jgi:hypothetical protein
MTIPWAHVYLTMHGKWTSGAFVGETGQIGIRYAIIDKINSADPSKPMFPMPSWPGSAEAFTDVNTTNLVGSVFWDAWVNATGIPGGDYHLNHTVQADMAEDARTFLTALAAEESVNWQWTHVKIALISRDPIPRPAPGVGNRGYYVYPSSVLTFKTPIAGKLPTSTHLTLPPEVACCASMRTAVLGRKGRGRVYVPALTVGALAPDGSVKPATATALATAVKTLNNNLANLPGFDPLMYNSGIVITSPGADTGVWPRESRVGNHFDVQRRRQLDEPQTNTTLSME